MAAESLVYGPRFYQGPLHVGSYRHNCAENLSPGMLKVFKAQWYYADNDPNSVPRNAAEWHALGLAHGRDGITGNTPVTNNPEYHAEYIEGVVLGQS